MIVDAGAIPGCSQGAAGPPLFLYYHKQIRGSGEHTQMQIAAHFNLAL